MKRTLAWIALGLLGLPFLVVAAYYGYENWAGYREWTVAYSELKTRGEPMRLADIRNAPVPDEHNIAAAPIFQELFSSPKQAVLSGVRLPSVAGIAEGNAASDLIALARRFRADFSGDSSEAIQVIRAGIAPMESIIESVAAAAARPETVWPMDYSQGFKLSLPFLDPLLKLSGVLKVRATTALASGDSSQALSDFDLIIDLARRSNQTGMLVSALVEQAMLQDAVDLVANGLESGAWSDSDLAHLQRELAGFAPLASLARSMRGERVMFLEFSPQLAAKAAPFFSFVDYSTELTERITRGLSRVLWALRPSGWDARDRARYAQSIQSYLDEAIAGGIVVPEAVESWSSTMRYLRRNQAEFFRTPLTVLAVPAFNAVARKAAFTQARIDLAIAACAIERCRRTTGKLPDDLQALTPGYLNKIPADVVRGGPLVYRTTGDGYCLYSIGWNGVDDGGPKSYVNKADDWVWAGGDPAN